jgi:hypothetical protein
VDGVTGVEFCRGVLVYVIAGIAQRYVMKRISKPDVTHMRQIGVLWTGRYGGQHMAKERLALHLGISGRRAFDDLFRIAGEDPVILPMGKRSAGISL